MTQAMITEEKAKAATTVKTNSLTWFEIPTSDLDRATAFYEKVMGAELRREVFGYPLAMFPANPDGVTGALVAAPGRKPGPGGTMVYLNCCGDLDAAAGRVEAAGGTVLVPVTAVPGGFGRFSLIEDSEGNHVSLHSS
jgi:predicted enzyme related to lactoylglutathione lyase